MKPTLPKVPLLSRPPFWILMVLALFAPFSQARSQGHVNGPSTSGQSIPITAETEIEIELLLLATEACYDLGVSDLLELILWRRVDLSQVMNDYQGQYQSTKGPGHYCKVASRTEARTKVECYLYSSRVESPLAYQSGDNPRFAPPTGDLNSADFNLATFYSSSDVRGHLKVTYRLGAGGSTALHVPTPNLILEFIDRSTYDDLGNEVQRRHFAKNPRFEWQDQGDGWDLAALPIYNAETGIKIQPTFNFERIMNCIKGHISGKQK